MTLLSGFNWADAVIMGIIILSALISFFRGFVRETLSLASWVLSLWAAYSFYKPFSALFLQKYIHSPTLLAGAAFGIVFLTVLIICGIINYFIHQLVYKTGLAGTDRLLGVLFGAARGILLISVLLLSAHLTPMPSEKWWRRSILMPYFEPIQLWLKNILPKSVSGHFELSQQ